MTRRDVVLAAGAVAALGSRAAAAGPAGDEAAIRRQLDRWRELFSRTGAGKRFTLDGYDDLYLATDDLLVYDSYVPAWADTRIAGFAEYRRVWERDINESFPGFAITRLDVERVEVAGDLGWSALTFVGHGRRADGTAYTGSQHGTHVWKKRGGAWRIAHEHLTGPVKEKGKDVTE